MTTRYRVDRNDSSVRVPIGMVQLLYLGVNWDYARKVFDATNPGLDGWNQPNSLYGVTIAVWNEDEGKYVVKVSKGLNHG